MTTDHSATRPPTTATAATALLRLLARADRDPQCTPLITSVSWFIAQSGTRIGGSYWSYGRDEAEPSALLQAARALFGGEISDSGERCDEDHTWHTLTFTVAGIPVLLRAAVPTVTVERQLRDRIAELEALAAGQASAA